MFYKSVIIPCLYLVLAINLSLSIYPMTFQCFTMFHYPMTLQYFTMFHYDTLHPFILQHNPS